MKLLTLLKQDRPLRDFIQENFDLIGCVTFDSEPRSGKPDNPRSIWYSNYEYFYKDNYTKSLKEIIYRFCEANQQGGFYYGPTTVYIHLWTPRDKEGCMGFEGYKVTLKLCTAEILTIEKITV
jgi:hypothetical protein